MSNQACPANESISMNEQLESHPRPSETLARIEQHVQGRLTGCLATSDSSSTTRGWSCGAAHHLLREATGPAGGHGRDQLTDSGQRDRSVLSRTRNASPATSGNRRPNRDDPTMAWPLFQYHSNKGNKRRAGGRKPRSRSRQTSGAAPTP